MHAGGFFVCKVCGDELPAWTQMQIAVRWRGHQWVEKGLCNVCFRWAMRIFGQ